MPLRRRKRPKLPKPPKRPKAQGLRKDKAGGCRGTGIQQQERAAEGRPALLCRRTDSAPPFIGRYGVNKGAILGAPSRSVGQGRSFLLPAASPARRTSGPPRRKRPAALSKRPGRPAEKRRRAVTAGRGAFGPSERCPAAFARYAVSAEAVFQARGSLHTAADTPLSVRDAQKGRPPAAEAGGRP